MSFQDTKVPVAAHASASALSVRAPPEADGAEPATAPFVSLVANAGSGGATHAMSADPAALGAGAAVSSAAQSAGMQPAAQAASGSCGQAIPGVSAGEARSLEGTPEDSAGRFQVLSAAKLVKMRARNPRRGSLCSGGPAEPPLQPWRKKRRADNGAAASMRPAATAPQQQPGEPQAGNESHPGAAAGASEERVAALPAPSIIPSPERRVVAPKMPGGAPACGDTSGAHAPQAHAEGSSAGCAPEQGQDGEPEQAQREQGERPAQKRKKASGLVMYEGGCGLVREPVPDQAELQAAAAALVRATPGATITHAPGEEPYRRFGIAVNKAPLVSVEEVARVQGCQALYWQEYKKAIVSEAERVKGARGKVSQRPDHKARDAVTRAGRMVNTPKTAGHVPGHKPGARCFLRDEIACLGLHAPSVAGIYCAAAPELPPSCPVFALSVVSSGGYANDVDQGERVTYTGQGGGNLRTPSGSSTSNQQMKFGNLALVGNIELGIPVRMLRKNDDPGSDFGFVYVNDGLYNVVGYRVGKNAFGNDVFLYDMVRRPGQEALLSKTVSYGGSSAPKGLSIESRGRQVRVVCDDISCGLENIKIPAVNGVDEENPFVHVNASADGGAPPPNTDWSGGVHVSRPLARYVVANELAEGVPSLAPKVLPDRYRDNPHKYVERLNSGRLPYIERKGRCSASSMVLADNAVMVSECGPWSGCRLGAHCPQAVTQQGLKWRLEVFKTPNRGWGVRSWDTIPAGSYVITYTGRVHKLAPVLEACRSGERDDTFMYDMCKRADMRWDNTQLHGLDPDHEVKYVIDAGDIGGVARYINHSCDSNLWVQPVMAGGSDFSMPDICLFAARNVPAFTELTYDYGQQYVDEKLGGACLCGATACRGSNPNAASAAQRRPDGDTSEEHSSGDRRRRRAAHRHDDVYEYGGQSDDSMPSS